MFEILMTDFFPIIMLVTTIIFIIDITMYESSKGE